VEAVLEFLRQLSRNNTKDWFDSHREHYQHLRASVVSLAQDVHAGLLQRDLDLAFCNPAKAVFRINRDVRFSQNKQPYKTNMGFWLSRGAKSAVAAGYYVHIDPQESFIAAGLYMPPAEALEKVRREIYYRGADLDHLLNTAQVKKTYGTLQDHRLKTVPRGYDKMHPYIDYLRQKSFVLVKPLKIEDLQHNSLGNYMAKQLAPAVPLVKFINEALDLDALN
jgi:uncharacterized protein (TIGR02453 family)